MHEHNHKFNNNQSNEKKLLISIFINLTITIAEIIGGIISGSLALLSDSFHNLSDVFALLISYFAILIGKKEKDSKKSFGYKRAEIIAALFNVIVLIIICGYIVYEAIKRIKNPESINTNLMLIIAFIGFAGNGISVLLLFKNSNANINIKSAFLHLLADTISSVAVIIVAIIMLFKPIYILDTILSVLIALYIIKESFSILIQSLNILMQATPPGYDYEKIKKCLLNDTTLKIKNMHHLHIWEITPGQTVFDAHIVINKNELVNADEIIYNINNILLKEFNICHSTIQLESENFNHCTSCDL
jgi:cobalt-zinc-cadmium efflux system protein